MSLSEELFAIHLCGDIAEGYALDAKELELENLELKAQIEQLRLDNETIEGCLAWLSTFEQLINVGVGCVESAAGLLTRYIQQVSQLKASRCSVEKHPDDLAVDRFALAMKTKMDKARAKGRYGWNDKTECTGSDLAAMLIAHLSKGNPETFEDIANFAMMLHQRDEDTELLRIALALRDAEIKAQAIEEAIKATSSNKYLLPLRDVCDLYEYADQLRQKVTYE